MGKLTKFQIIVLVIFVVGIFVGLASLALIKNTTKEDEQVAITVWGVIPENTILSFLSEVNRDRANTLLVTYVEKSQSNFERDLTEELALGKGPDAILVPQEMILTFENKLLTIPYTTIPARTYKDTFIPQAELYLRDTGIVGIPFTIDPMVMYWNRDMYTNAGFALPPKIWDDFVNVTKKINQKDVNNNIRKSAIAMGEFANILNARDIFSLILLQAGNPITVNKKSTLSGAGLDMTENALNFFNGFSNPSSPAYSWNRSLPSAKNFFLAGNLATYLGFASESSDIREKNPNLNFDIAPIPQPKNAANRVGYGRLYGFSIVKSSANPSATLAIVSELASAPQQAKLVNLTYLPPVRRDLIAGGNTDPYLSIFYDAALISRSWLDPSPYTTARIFQTMAEAVTSGRSLSTQAINDAHSELDILLQSK